MFLAIESMDLHLPCPNQHESSEEVQDESSFLAVPQSYIAGPTIPTAVVEGSCQCKRELPRTLQFNAIEAVGVPTVST